MKISYIWAIAFFIVSVFVNPLKAENPVKYGVMGAVNYSTITSPDHFNGNNIDDLNWKLGYKAGLISDVPMGSMFSIQPSLLFSSKGYKMEESLEGTQLNGSFSITANYIELPIMLAFKIPFSENVKLSINAGPYLAYGIAGKTGFKANAGSAYASTNWNTFDKKELAGIEVFPAMQRFDYGLGLGAALEFGIMKLSVNYDQGLAPVYDVSNSDNNSYHYGFWSGLGFFF